MPPNGAATKAEDSTMRMPARIGSVGMMSFRSASAERVFEQGLRHHFQRQRLLGPLEDREHARIDVVAAYRRLFRIAHAAVNLQRLARHHLRGAARE